MKNILEYLIIGTLCALINIANAQPNVTINDFEALPNSEVQIPITTASFTNLVGMQFTFRWDDSILEYNRVENININGVSSDRINHTPDSAFISFQWDDPALLPQSLTDGTVIFTLVFDVIGNVGDVSPLWFDSSPTLIEAINNIDGNIDEVDLITGNGSLEVVTSLAVGDLSVDTFGSISPNPFNTFTTIQFDNDSREDAQLQIYASNGKLIHNNIVQLIPGNNTLNVKADVFDQEGVFVIQLQTSSNLFIDKLIYVK